MCPTFLHKIKASPEEQLEGSIKLNFLHQENDLKLYEQQNKVTNMEPYMSTQKVNDKTVADAVEALLGTYLQVRNYKLLKLITFLFKIHLFIMFFFF